jgi:hypothetical protein
MDLFGFGRFSYLALILIYTASAAAGPREPLRFADVGSGLSIQFTDKLLLGSGWRDGIDLAVASGARLVRVDLNWDWIETKRDVYDWSLYDPYVAELQRRGLRPLFILNRTNALHGAPFKALVDGRQTEGISPPSSAADIGAFVRWATTAAERYRESRPIWEIWNEPDMEGFWPPRPNPPRYVALARATCKAIRAKLPGAVVVGPAVADMPTVWRQSQPLLNAVFADAELHDCLDAVSIHTHRFGQTPETISRDYAVMRARYEAAVPADRRRPIIDTEWGDSVFDSGISEATQAEWLPRMVLVNLMEGVGLTNWYCLLDVGADNNDMEHRFGLVRADGSKRPAFGAYQVLAHELGGYQLHDTLARFDASSAQGATALLFCDGGAKCKVAAWTTEDAAKVALTGWRTTDAGVDHLGRPVGGENLSQTIKVGHEVRYVPVEAVK